MHHPTPTTQASFSLNERNRPAFQDPLHYLWGFQSPAPYILASLMDCPGMGTEAPDLGTETVDFVTSQKDRPVVGKDYY